MGDTPRMRYLITGTAGFIGNALALRLLQAGHHVTGVDALTDYYDVRLKRDRLERLAGFSGYTDVRADIGDMDALRAAFEDARPERVMHLAAQAGVRHSLEHPRHYVDTNVVGSFNVVELCREFGVGHLLLASTSSAYGASTDYPFHETDRAAFPLTIYAATKLASEMIAHSHSHLHGVPTTALRFFTVYGPWGRPDMAPMLFATAMSRGEPIRVFNHGDMHRDFTHIDDLTEAMAQLADHPPVRGQPVQGVTDSLSPVAPFRVVNIGNAEPVRLLDFIQTLERHLGVEARLDMQPMQPGDVVRTHADTSLLEALTGGRPRGDLDAGVADFVRWFRDYHAAG